MRYLFQRHNLLGKSANVYARIKYVGMIMKWVWSLKSPSPLQESCLHPWAGVHGTSVIYCHELLHIQDGRRKGLPQYPLVWALSPCSSPLASFLFLLSLHIKGLHTHTPVHDVCTSSVCTHARLHLAHIGGLCHESPGLWPCQLHEVRQMGPSCSACIFRRRTKNCLHSQMKGLFVMCHIYIHVYKNTTVLATWL